MVAKRAGFVKAFAAAALLAGCAAASNVAHAADQVSVRLKWVAQAQFAGFYVAKEKGFYAQEGLDVTINPGGPNLNGETLVGSGADHFALAGGIESLLASRDKGLPIVGLAMMLQQTPSAYVAYSDSGIKSPSDFKGKRVSTFFTGAQNMLFAVLSKAGIQQNELTIIPQAVTMAPFIDKQVDVATVMRYNELNVLKARGITNLTVIRPEEHGVNIPSDPIIVNEKTLAERPQVVQKFLNGSLRGWKYALQNKAEAIDIMMKIAPSLDRKHQEAMLEEYGKLIAADNGTARGVGYLDRPVLESAKAILVERGALKPDANLDKALDTRFWDAVPADYKKL